MEGFFFTLLYCAFMKAGGRVRAREKNNLSLMGFGDKKLAVPGSLLFCLYLASSMAQPITEHTASVAWETVWREHGPWCVSPWQTSVGEGRHSRSRDVDTNFCHIVQLFFFESCGQSFSIGRLLRGLCERMERRCNKAHGAVRAIPNNDLGPTVVELT